MADFMVACVLYTLTRLNFDFTAYLKLGPWLLASINGLQLKRQANCARRDLEGAAATRPLLAQSGHYDRADPCPLSRA